MVRVDVLTDEGYLAHASNREVLHVFEDFLNGPGHLRAARVRHDTESAELVAAFLHGHKRRDAARTSCGFARRRKKTELVLDRELGHDRTFLAPERVRQPMIALWPDHQIDHGRPADDFLAFGLRDAARDRNGDAASFTRCAFFELTHAAEFRIDLFGRLFADMAGGWGDQVGLPSRARLRGSVRPQPGRPT